MVFVSKVLRVGLVACCSTKRTVALPARDLYVSTLFSKSRRWVERNTDEWAILSALHGLVHPEQVLEPYDLTLNTLPASKVRQWADKVNHQLRAKWDADATLFVVLAGSKYRTALSGLNCHVPMRGLGIGKQLAWLTAAEVGAR